MKPPLNTPRTSLKAQAPQTQTPPAKQKSAEKEAPDAATNPRKKGTAQKQRRSRKPAPSQSKAASSSEPNSSEEGSQRADFTRAFGECCARRKDLTVPLLTLLESTREFWVGRREIPYVA